MRETPVLCPRYLPEAEAKRLLRHEIANFRVITVIPTKQCAVNLCEKLRIPVESRATLPLPIR